MLGKWGWFRAVALAWPVAYGLALALSASAFEETGRLVLLRTLRHRRPSLSIPVAYAFGHAGVEAMLVVGPAAVVAGDQASSLVVVERLSALAAHVGFSVLVYVTVMRGRPLPFLAALLLHADIDALAIPMQLGVLSAVGGRDHRPPARQPSL